MESINALSFLAFFLCMTAGAYFHYRKVRRTGRHGGNLFDYLVADNPTGSGTVGLLILLASWTAATSGTADLINIELIWALITNFELHIPSINVAIMAVSLGYTFDSQFNKGGNEK